MANGVCRVRFISSDLTTIRVHYHRVPVIDSILLVRDSYCLLALTSSRGA